MSHDIQVILVVDARIRVYALVDNYIRAGTVCKNRDKQLTHIDRVMRSILLKIGKLKEDVV